MCKLKRKPTSMFTGKNAPRQKMILLFLCILTREKSTPSGGEIPKPGKTVCDCEFKRLKTRGFLAPGTLPGTDLPPIKGLGSETQPPPSPATFPAYSQVTRLSASAFGGISLPRCGCAEHFSYASEIRA